MGLSVTCIGVWDSGPYLHLCSFTVNGWIKSEREGKRRVWLGFYQNWWFLADCRVREMLTRVLFFVCFSLRWCLSALYWVLFFSVFQHRTKPYFYLGLLYIHQTLSWWFWNELTRSLFLLVVHVVRSFSSLVLLLLFSSWLQTHSLVVTLRNREPWPCWQVI